MVRMGASIRSAVVGTLLLALGPVLVLVNVVGAGPGVPILEITDALETPPRVKRILPPRKCRKDDSWIRSDKE